MKLENKRDKYFVVVTRTSGDFEGWIIEEFNDSTPLLWSRKRAPHKHTIKTDMLVFYVRTDVRMSDDEMTGILALWFRGVGIHVDLGGRDDGSV